MPTALIDLAKHLGVGWFTNITGLVLTIFQRVGWGKLVHPNMFDSFNVRDWSVEFFICVELLLLLEHNHVGVQRSQAHALPTTYKFS